MKFDESRRPIYCRAWPAAQQWLSISWPSDKFRKYLGITRTTLYIIPEYLGKVPAKSWLLLWDGDGRIGDLPEGMKMLENAPRVPIVENE